MCDPPPCRPPPFAGPLAASHECGVWPGVSSLNRRGQKGKPRGNISWPLDVPPAVRRIPVKPRRDAKDSVLFKLDATTSPSGSQRSSQRGGLGSRPRHRGRLTKIRCRCRSSLWHRTGPVHTSGPPIKAWTGQAHRCPRWYWRPTACGSCSRSCIVHKGFRRGVTLYSCMMPLSMPFVVQKRVIRMRDHIDNAFADANHFVLGLRFFLKGKVHG